MKLAAFIAAVDKLVMEWKGADAFDPRGIPKEKLEKIWREVRNTTAHELAQAVERGDRLSALYHKELIRSDEKKTKPTP